jgi:anti-anti-sigma factor
MSSPLFTTDTLDGQLHVSFHGRLDTANSAAVHDPLIALVNASDQPIVFDLSDVTFIASAFLRLCIMSAQKAGKENFRIAQATPAVRHVFGIAGLDRHLRMD